MPPDFYGPGLPNDGPTDAPPGSAKKVEVLMRRAAKRQALWHPGDARDREGAAVCLLEDDMKPVHN
jgi:hypothetical protein